MLQASSFAHPARPRAIAYWLLFVAALILAIVVVGGITRLTESGLSITQWKRIIGGAFALPLVWFAVRRRIPRGYLPRLVALLALIGLQGTFGWLMVRSGLSARTEVAPLWLATHLLTALFTFAGMIWTALDLLALDRNPGARPARLTGIADVAGDALFVQLFYRALMA